MVPNTSEKENLKSLFQFSSSNLLIFKHHQKRRGGIMHVTFKSMLKQAVLRTGIIFVNNAWGQTVNSYIDLPARDFSHWH